MTLRNRALTAAVAAVLVVSPAVVSVVTSAEATARAAAPPAPEVPAGFQDIEVIPGLSEPTAVAFAPDGTAFVGLKPGVVKAFDYSSATGQYEPWATHTDVVSLVQVVHNYHDRGLTGVAVDPQFGTAGHSFIYVNYAYDRDPRDEPRVVPRWGSGGGGYDDCAAPAAMGPPVVTGCVGMTRVSRIPVTKGANGYVASGPEQPLVDLPAGQAACQQFGSHASGDVVFGPDGMLYASAGDGASFDSLDYGQAGNPCADPVDEGGALRAQDLRTSGDPLGLGGTIFRIDPNGGQVAAGAQANASRIVTYGQRNPWRLTFRPGTSELWSGDVGASGWEEVNRTDMSSFSGPVNLGWPCFEGSYTGSQRNVGWDQLDKPVCENLYAAEQATPGTVRPPYFSYQTRGSTGPLTPGEHCEQGTSSVSGVAFVPSTSSYPAQYRGALFFNDFARSCVWYLAKKTNGDPDPTQIKPFVQRAESPVQVRTGPGGDLFYVDYGIVDGNVVAGAGGLHRITYTTGNRQPVAAVTASPSAGPAPLAVTFDASGSSDPDGDALSYAWDLDGDTEYDDGTGVTQSRTYSTPGNVTVSVQVSDGRGGTDTETVTVSPGNSPPTITSMSPGPSFTWTAGQSVTLSATATDPQQTLPDSAYAWSVILQHCPSVCHTHPLTGGTGRTLTFTTVGHEYPADLLVTLTVTDAQGLTDVETVELDPRTVDLTFATSPAGGAMTVAGAGVFSGHVQRFIVGSTVDVAVPDTRSVGGATYAFSSWSDGGGRSHQLNAPAAAATLTATYTRQNRLPTATLSANPTSGTTPLTVDFTAGATDPDGDDTAFTYEWALDPDGVFDDGGGTTRSRQYTTPGTRTVRVRVTDAHGGQNTEQVTVNVSAPNRPPVAAVTATPASGYVPLTVGLDATGSADPDGDALTYEWALDPDGVFDDGGGSSRSRTYANAGPVDVKVRVFDGRGGTDVATVRVSPGTRDPEGIVYASPGDPGLAPLATTFHAEFTDPEGKPLTYRWDLDEDGEFDDGGTAATQQHTFTGVGVHRVYVQVDDPDGGRWIAFATVQVLNSNPTAGLSAAPASGTAPLTTTLTATASDPDGTAMTYAWDLDGDGEYDDGGTAATQTATFATTGAHVVGVQVTDADGGKDVATTTVTVTQRPPARGTLRVRVRPHDLLVKVDGATHPHGWSAAFDVGSVVRVAAARHQRLHGVVYEFVRWSDGGRRSHRVTVGSGTLTLRAVYRAQT